MRKQTQERTEFPVLPVGQWGQARDSEEEELGPVKPRSHRDCPLAGQSHPLPRGSGRLHPRVLTARVSTLVLEGSRTRSHQGGHSG